MPPRRIAHFPLAPSRILAMAVLCAAVAPAAAAQMRSTPISLSLPAAAVLQVASGAALAGSGQGVSATPGGSSVLTMSYRASQGGGAALTVAAMPSASGGAGIIVAVQGPPPAGGAFTASRPLVSPQTGPVVLWQGGPAAHGLDQRLAVRYAAPASGSSGRVTLVYTFAVS